MADEQAPEIQINVKGTHFSLIVALYISPGFEIQDQAS
jgi:hypothetical protein